MDSVAFGEPLEIVKTQATNVAVACQILGVAQHISVSIDLFQTIAQ